MTPATIAALVREARALIDAPADDPRRAGFQARKDALLAEGCHADRDGDCSWAECPQLRDGEPGATGRHCPRDVRGDGE